jgi:RsmE family RNA methyltransferase
MNVVLFAPSEVGPQGRVRLPAADRRARHLRSVLRVAAGDSVRVGILDGELGRAHVVCVAGDHIELACAFGEPAPGTQDVLVLAIPRPKVLLRCVETAAALGFAHILLVRTWRTDKSHVVASALAAPALRAHALLGLEQARRTRVPAIEVFPLFRPFVEDHLDARCAGASCWLADPEADLGIAQVADVPERPFALAIGPERGFTEFEREQLVANGFMAIHAGAHPLRVETALAFVSGQLVLRRAMR